jgi:energy-coupling factor transporter ATP-binding protein EcfA2
MIDLEISKILDNNANTIYNTFFYKHFETFPNKFVLGKFKLNFVEFFTKNNWEEVYTKFHNPNYSEDYKKYYGEFIYKHPYLDMLITFFPSDYGDWDSLVAYCYYTNQEDIDKIIPIVEEYFHYEVEEDLNKVFLIKSNKNGLSTIKLELPEQKIDVENYYNEDFQPIFEKITSKLSEENSKGLVLLHGIMGSGKSSLIKHLTKVVKNKKFIFIPSYMSNVIVNPDFTEFIMEHRNSILVLEDAETILIKRDVSNGSAQAVSNILNLTDGILADGLNIQIIATFNTDLKNLDEALLRKGRLIAKYEFKELEIDKCNKIFENSDVEYRTSSPMTLAEIFNVDDKIGMVEKVVKNKIGF